MGIAREWFLQFCEKAEDVDGMSATIYNENGRIYAISDQPVVYFDKPEDNNVNEIVDEFLKYTSNPKIHCNDDSAIHFSYAGHVYHMCLDDPDVVYIYLEIWEW